MAALFIVLTIFGVVEVASTMVIFTFLRRHDHENPPFRVTAHPRRVRNGALGRRPAIG